MKVLFDHQIFSQQKFGGISRYFCELMHYLKLKEKVQVTLATKYSSNAYLKSYSLGKEIKDLPENSLLDEYSHFIPFLKFRGKGRLFNLVRKLKDRSTLDFKLLNALSENRKASIEALKEKNYDIFHPTYYDPYFADYLNGRPYVITVYDMIHELFPEFFPLDSKLSSQKKEVINKATKIIAISNQTKTDLVNIFYIKPEKVKVIYLSGSIKKMRKIALPDKFILFGHNRTVYKNFYLLCRAISIVRKKIPDLKLVCYGGGKFTEEEKTFLQELDLFNYTYYLEPTDAQLAYIFSKASLFIFPSLYEGFGISLIEALRSNCIVAASNIGCFREICEDSAIYFEPKDMHSIVNAIKKGINDKKLRKTLRSRGLKRASHFSWEKTARETLKIYKELL